MTPNKSLSCEDLGHRYGRQSDRTVSNRGRRERRTEVLVGNVCDKIVTGKG